MNIKSKLYLSAGVSIVLIVVLVSMVLVTSGRIAEEDKKHQRLMDVYESVSELDIVTYDYLLHREERMEHQWNIKHDSLGKILDGLAEEAGLKSIRADYATLGNLFSQITAHHEERQKYIQEGASQEKIDAITGLEERLVAQLLITSQSLITDASRLAEEANAEATEAQRLASNLIVILMIVLAIAITTSSLLVARSISKPLGELTKGTEIIGKGDLEHRVSVTSKDELGQLATAFNQMTTSLSETTASRDELEKTAFYLDSMADTLIVLSPDTNIIKVNKAFYELWGYTPEEVYGKTVLELFPEEESIKHQTEMQKGVETGAPRIFESIALAKYGKRIPVSVTGIVITDDGGQPTALVGIFSDITERLQMQERLLTAERLATLGQFSGNISHELRNPLAVIDSSAYYLQTKLKDADAKVREHLDRIKASVTTSSTIIDSLLNLTRMNEPELKPVNLVAVTQDAIASSNLSRKVVVDKTFPEREILVNADREQLRLAFKNIIQNASEAMDGSGRLKVEICTIGKDEAEISFSDSGPGIPEADMGRIFQPLFTNKASGIGFGLSISKMVIDKHSGTIEVLSEEGKGAVFNIRLQLYLNNNKERENA